MATDGREDRLHFDEDQCTFDGKVIEEMKSSIQEIQTTNKFILKRLSSQQTQMEQQKGELADIPDGFLSRIEQLETKDRQQEQEMKALMEKVSVIGDRISTMCQFMDTVKSDSASTADGVSLKPGKMSRMKMSENKKENGQQNSLHEEKMNGSLSEKEKQILLDNDERDMDMKHDADEDHLLNKLANENHSDNIQSNGRSHIVTNDSEVEEKLLRTHEENIPERKVEKGVLYGGARPKTKPLPDKASDFVSCLELPPEEDQSPLGAMQSSFKAKARLEVVECDDWLATADYESKKARESELPHGTGISTVFLLDVSESMRGKGLEQLQAVCHSILDDIERAKTDLNLDENVAVVTFGGETKCLQFLTNDYGATRKVIDELTVGGASPMCGGLCFTLSPMKLEEGTTTTIVFGTEVHPRVILISDGRATDSKYPSGPEDPEAYVWSEVKDGIDEVVRGLAESKIPVFCVPVGDADERILQSIAETTTGSCVAPSDSEMLGRHFTNLATVMELKKDFPPGQVTRTDLEMVLKLKNKDVKEQDLTYMMQILSNPVYCPLSNMDEDEEFEELEEGNAQMPPIGTRVRRGPDWKWKNQDSDGPGTVIGHGRNGWIKVEWDTTNKAVYRYGVDNNFDVVVHDEPRILKQELIATGCLVKRGDNWRYGNQDGGPEKIGVVYKVETNGQIWVRWPNKQKYRYTYGGLDGQLDVQVCNPFEVQEQLAAQQESEAAQAANTLNVSSCSRRSSSSSDMSDEQLDFHLRGDVTPPLEKDSANGMSIYDMAPPPVIKKRSEVEEALHLSLIEEMNRRNETPTEEPQASHLVNKNTEHVESRFAGDTGSERDSSSLEGDSDEDYHNFRDLKSTSDLEGNSSQVMKEVVTGNNGLLESSLPLNTEINLSYPTSDSLQRMSRSSPCLPDESDVTEHQFNKSLMVQVIDKDREDRVQNHEQNLSATTEKTMKTTKQDFSDDFSEESEMVNAIVTNSDNSNYSNENEQILRTSDTLPSGGIVKSMESNAIISDGEVPTVTQPVKDNLSTAGESNQDLLSLVNIGLTPSTSASGGIGKPLESSTPVSGGKIRSLSTNTKDSPMPTMESKPKLFSSSFTFGDMPSSKPTQKPFSVSLGNKTTYKLSNFSEKQIIRAVKDSAVTTKVEVDNVESKSSNAIKESAIPSNVENGNVESKSSNAIKESAIPSNVENGNAESKSSNAIKESAIPSNVENGNAESKSSNAIKESAIPSNVENGSVESKSSNVIKNSAITLKVENGNGKLESASGSEDNTAPSNVEIDNSESSGVANDTAILSRFEYGSRESESTSEHIIEKDLESVLNESKLQAQNYQTLNEQTSLDLTSGTEVEESLLVQRSSSDKVDLQKGFSASLPFVRQLPETTNQESKLVHSMQTSSQGTMSRLEAQSMPLVESESSLDKRLKNNESFSDTFSDTASMVSEVSTVVETNCVWQWQDEHGDWVSYPEDMNQKIEKAKKRGNRSTALVQLQGESYRVVIHKGIHLHTVTRSESKIRCIDRSDVDLDEVDV